MMALLNAAISAEMDDSMNSRDLPKWIVSFSDELRLLRWRILSYYEFVHDEFTYFLDDGS